MSIQTPQAPDERLNAPATMRNRAPILEVLTRVPDAWIDEGKTKVGYEIPFTRHFYKYTPPRPLDEIDAEICELGAEIQEFLKEVAV